MSIADQWDLMAAMPLLAAAAGISYIALVAVSGTALRLVRKQKKRDRDAKRTQVPDTPWSEWLREINDKHETKEERAEGRWRE